MNIFKNIRFLDLSKNSDNLFWTDQKINLPNLQTLRVDNSIQLTYFTGLKTLKQIYIKIWHQEIIIDDIFDPLKIFDLES